MDEYSKALLHCEKALEMQQETLPVNHSDLPNVYNSIGCIYDNMSGYGKAIPTLKRAVELQKETLPNDPSQLAILDNDIGIVHHKTGNTR
jgi:tetratricopeptide (TPR) repeat protein